MKKTFSLYAPNFQENNLPLPLFLEKVVAGFPSPANDFIEQKLDLNELIIKHPASTFFVKVEGNSMVNANIQTGDILVVDRSISASNGKIIVAIINGEFTVKRLFINEKTMQLLPENDNYPVIEITDQDEFQVWGVVTYVIHKT
ncbi:LexA repressor [Candidatus Rubidus massiliensis]|nr:MAG: peptidase S24 [Chlamydia sp. 32-24]CDZ80672.1 LexA repressor [Candidatus Rubidus massiliensis]